MPVKKKFAINFILSLLMSVVIGVATLVFVWILSWGANAVPVLLIIIALLLMSFVIGTKLNLLGTPWLNYLSVCGGLLISGVLHWLLMPGINGFWFLLAFAILLSTMMWLGMFYKSKTSPN